MVAEPSLPVDSLHDQNLKQVLVDLVHPDVDKVRGIAKDNERQVDGVSSSLCGVHEPMTYNCPAWPSMQS